MILRLVIPWRVGLLTGERDRKNVVD
jgi:hypothetical protein